MTELGEAATYAVGSDRYPATVIAIRRNGHEIDIQFDGHGVDHATGETLFAHNPEGRIMTATLRKNGKFMPKGAGLRDGQRIVVGHRSYYQDPSF